jgi:dipeptidyl aminopeptidase/acylaminoacyl peptidase
MRPIKQYTAGQFLNTIAISGGAFSPNEQSILFTSNQTGIFNAYTLPISEGGPRQLTYSTNEAVHAISYFQYDSRILISRDRGGNENDHLLVIEVTGKEKDLTPGLKAKARFLGWSRDDESFFYMTNERDPRFFDVYRADSQSLAGKLIYQNDFGHYPGDVSKDGNHIALIHFNTATDSDIFLYSVSTKAINHISPHEGDVSYRVVSFDTTSRYLYYLTDNGNEYLYLVRWDSSSGETELIERAEGDILWVCFSQDGVYRVVGSNENARTKVKIHNQTTGRDVVLPDSIAGDITDIHISSSGRLMSFCFNSDRAPNNLYVFDFATQELRKLTESLNPEIDSADLVESEVVSFQSFDQIEIPSLLWKPHQSSSSNKAPALVWVHGGPGGQTRKGYVGFLQYLVNRGYVVLGVNVRGSSGYGKSFYAADERKHGREPLWDCIAAKNFLSSLKYVDASKIGIIGISYGGYMVLAALTFSPEEFVVGVDLFGISNLVRVLESIPPYMESSRRAIYARMGDPQVDRERLVAISPLFHAKRITKPLMVVHGENDTRVSKTESDEIVEAVRQSHGTVEYLIFEDEGHGLTKRANQIRAYEAIFNFLDRYLKRNKMGSVNATTDVPNQRV